MTKVPHSVVLLYIFMSMPPPLVSVVLPVYNAATYLPEAIESILAQTYSHLELIIIDDASTDDSRQIISRYAKQDKRIKLIQNEHNLKLSKTLNRGIDLAKGEYIARMDADDISLPERFALQVDFLQSHPEVGILGGTMEIVNARGEHIATRSYDLTDREVRKYIFRYCPFSHPLIMIRKSILDKVGGYKHEFNPAEDYDLYFRLGTCSQFANLSETLLKYRVVEKSMTTGSTKYMERETIRIRRIFSSNPHYHFGIVDMVYNLLHSWSLYFIPSPIKLYLFNLIRNR